MDAPVAETSGFPMCLAPEGREARTRISIVERGYLGSRRVTRLRMCPLTGRRHQLRLHCALLGHPIVGDLTYSPADLQGRPQKEEGRSHDPMALANVSGGVMQAGEPRESGRLEVTPRANEWPRLMLHAFRLVLPFGPEDKCGRMGPTGGKPLDVCSTDPFEFAVGQAPSATPSADDVSLGGSKGV